MIQRRTGLVVSAGHFSEVFVELLEANPEARGQTQECGTEIVNLPHHIGRLEED